MVEPPLSDYEVIRFLVNRGGRCTNYELVSNFRGILNDPLHQAEARLKFKDIINTVAIVGEFQNVKYIELKKEYSISNHDRSRNEEYETSGHSSIVSESSGSSSYNSPFSQSFQPYWRYRLSTSPQLPPPKIPLDLQSSTSKTFNRSVSDSTLPPDRPPPPRTRSFRGTSEEGHSTRINASIHQQPFCSKDQENRKHISHSKLQNEFLSVPVDQRRYSSGYYSSSDSASVSSSLPYYPPEVHKNFNQSHDGLLMSRENAQYSSRMLYPEKHPNKTNSEKSLSMSSTHQFDNKQHADIQQNANLRVQGRKIYSESCISQPEPFVSNKINYNYRSPSSCELRKTVEQNSPRRKSFDSSKFETPSSRNILSNLSTPKNNWENSDENDVFADPNYMRTVSKMCLEKNKTSQPSPQVRNSNFNSPELHLESKAGSSLNKIRQKELNVNQTSKEITNFNFSHNNHLKEPANHLSQNEDAPTLPERIRKSQDFPEKLMQEVEENVEYQPSDEPKSDIVSSKVRDRVQHFDEMGKKQIKVAMANHDKENRMSIKSSSMEDDVSISVLDPKLKKEWFVKASQCDYHALISLLKKEPKLAALKDIASGYTALHWAAKHGDSNVVKLIAGAYKVNPNIRSNGGYTPIHLASLYKHDMISHLLIHTYGADASLRDYNGKRADQYPQNYIRTVAGQKNTERRPLKQRPLVAKETISSSFIRIGSLNLRKARKSTVFASVRGSNRNRNSVSDLRFGNQGSSRKKMHKKENLLLDKKSIPEKKDDEDSDSAYGFPSKKL